MKTDKESTFLGWTPKEREKLAELLAWWFPSIKYTEEEMEGADTVEELIELYEWAGGEQIEGSADDNKTEETEEEE